MPTARPATWATIGRPSACASSRSASTSRHTSGAWSGWLRLTLTVRPVRRGELAHPRPLVDRQVERGRGRTGTRRGRPCAIASAMPSSSSASASVPGTSSPAFDRWSGVREVENPSAPARSASSTMRGHRRDVVGGRPARWPRRGRPSRSRAPVRGRPARRCRSRTGVRRARRGTPGRLPVPRRFPRSAPCPGCPRRPPSARSATRGGPVRRARSRRRSCPSPPWSRRATTTA